mmetsp:Transcript_55221/g.63453  ORF Transcript_55221/g.63453 Transcript_55221/m.63453 type:complete len:159 (-) Transcript_55221:112-588(-)
MAYQPLTDLREGISQRNFSKVVKSLNYLIAIGIIIVGVVEFIDAIGFTTFFGIFRPIILIFMGLLLIAGDCELGWLVDYFGFLRSAIGRGIYCLWLAALSALSGMNNSEKVLTWLGNVLAIILLLNGIVLVVLGCKGKNEFSKEGEYKGGNYSQLLLN